MSHAVAMITADPNHAISSATRWSEPSGGRIFAEDDGLSVMLAPAAA